jgi:FKBP12-rapamycin complex-associated protein
VVDCVVLLPKARDVHPGVASRVLELLAELARVSEDKIMPYFDDIMQIIIETLLDQRNSLKRESALRALGMLVTNTGNVITPYLDYPNLLGILIGILKMETSVLIRREVVKVIGILGAIDPYKVCVKRLMVLDVEF